MKSWLKWQDLLTSCHWGGEKKGNKKKKIKTEEECSTGFHCLLLASRPCFHRHMVPGYLPLFCSGCHQDRFSQSSPERKSHTVGFQLPGSALSSKHQGAVLLISPPKHMAGWSNRPLIQLLLARQVWKQDKGWRATPTAQDPLSSGISEVLLCSDAAPQSDILWQPQPLSQHGAGSATEALAQWWHNKQPVLGWSR